MEAYDHNELIRTMFKSIARSPSEESVAWFIEHFQCSVKCAKCALKSSADCGCAVEDLVCESLINKHSDVWLSIWKNEDRPRLLISDDHEAKDTSPLTLNDINVAQFLLGLIQIAARLEVTEDE